MTRARWHWRGGKTARRPRSFCFWPGFGRVWQPALTAGAWITAVVALSGPAILFSGAPPSARQASAGPFPQFLLFLALQTCILMVAFAAFRPTFRWAAGMQAGVLAAGAWAFAFYRLPGDVSRFLQPTVLVFAAVLLAAYVQERLARGAFWANHLLNIERDAERRKREQTEATLGVLNQAIGGIVHDLGNPLTSVQTGAQTLRQFARDDMADPPLVDEFAGIIEDGARMLDYLRLSLIEQSRVLEGKPTPLDLQATGVRPLAEAGARYQKPRLAAGREIRVEGDDCLLYTSPSPRD